MSTVRDYIDASVLPWLPPGLISANALAEILQTAAKIPGGMTNFFGFECALSQADRNADLLVCAAAQEGARSILAGSHPLLGFPREFSTDYCWSRVFDFARHWNDPNLPLHDRVHNVWLEFDIGKTLCDLPSPSLFFGAFGLCRSSGNGVAIPPECSWLTNLALPVLRGEQLSLGEVAQVERCIDALPPGTFIFQVGLMLSRKQAGTRLCVRGLKPEQIRDYLSDAGWRGSTVELDALIRPLVDHVESFAVDLDVTDRIEPKIGLECYPAIAAGKAEEFVRHLAATGFASEQKAEAICQWRGMVHERISQAPWPSDLRATSALLNGAYYSMFYRRLHHVKIVYEPEKPLHAKAYLGVQHYWVDPKVLHKSLERRGSDSPYASVSQNVAEEKAACIAGSPCSC